VFVVTKMIVRVNMLHSQLNRGKGSKGLIKKKKKKQRQEWWTGAGRF